MGNSRQELPCIGILRIAQDPFGRTLLDDSPREPAFICTVGKPPAVTARSSDHLTSLATTGVPSWNFAFFISLKVTDMSPMFISPASSGLNLSRS